MLLPVLAAAGDIYKWTDEHGRVHYGDRPGADAAQSVDVRPAAPPSPSPDSSRRAVRRQRLLEVFAEERAERTAEARAERLQREQRRRNCELARRQLADYEHAAYIYDEDDSGQRRILGDDEHAALLSRARDAVSAWCR
ncbi:MAG: DUF4124 domain-containing protein [Gammaproteobacteria bacterium]|nr:DUF4124 domain-containing protein [Gammaproteobacteria bacterium]